MSRGSGRLQRRILELLETAPDRKKSREELHQMLVGNEGFDPSNVLRAIRGLARKRRVNFTDQRHKVDSFVQLPSKVEPVPESKVDELLAEIGGRKV